MELIEVASGLKFPEGPIAMADGSVILVEMFGPRITRVRPDGTKETIAEIVGGPNGAAIGPDGALYLCNNGGCFTEVDFGGLSFPGPFDPSRYSGGRIQRVDLSTGKVQDLYTTCDGRPLRAPNDLVFDNNGGFYFTDHGIRDLGARTSDLTGIYYAKADGSSIVEVDFPAESPNGIGLSPDGKKVYWAETHTGRVFQRDIVSPGVLSPTMPGDTSAVLCGLPGLQLLDSLAVDGAGNVCVATLVNGGITVIAPNGEILRHIPTGDLLTTNICFAADGSNTAWITLSGTGRLVRMEWPWPGLRLAHSA
ncbi:MAG: SMP-30/gluconolactonase/LRE family protein [Acidimicrobiia bacterium]|nr:SMP-30/gluconolactonase/LRE family protein [Actinomycetota bacterium]NDB05801.1 SMP-30/gluconolactonase/LRE family protein [Acidimicrobiia bacterium]NDD95951.1 SMP-30/gluconolactonase/LRE family protein [Actinomycetota bacterium]NDE57836.1 SMP-30/gluconolactonase/LRE family protein [Acidimicrobiia bacterium]NDH46473.1 SMP-30/gluconolactonase/LRE family protein [Acidimicrobiia bacterium]